MSTQPNQSSQPTPIRSVDQLVEQYLMLQEEAEAIAIRMGSVKASLAELGTGRHATSNGAVTVTVSPPSRSFNKDKAWTMLTAEQQALCVSPDAAKIKKQLSGVLVDECMEPGKGAPSVSVK